MARLLLPTEPMRPFATILAATVAAAACTPGEPPAPGSSPRDATRDGLYRDFLDGKFDGAGHPLGAVVWQAETACEPEVGYPAAEGWQVDAGAPRGLLCDVSTSAIGRGRFTVNVRSLAAEALPPGDAALEIAVFDAGDTELARRHIDRAQFAEPLVYRNAALTFTHRGDGAVRIEVVSAGAAVRVDYVELFRARRGISISPTSGELPSNAAIQLEVLDPPDGWSPALACGDLDLSDALAAALEAGDASRQDTDFRTVITAPAELLAPCERPTRVTASVIAGWTRAAARVTYRDRPPACAFDPDARGPRVLLTGFEPFPADAWHDNSSEQAVLGYDPSAHADLQLMRMVLPVEWETAASWVAEVVAECDPDIVLGFGQGRSTVDVETTAYNLMDSSAVSGGVPDNRGLVHGGTPIEPGGPAQRSTGVPVDTILADLAARGVTGNESDDPGRYICNNLFYAIMGEAERTGAVAGFVHLPYMTRFDEADRALLQHAVDATVAGALDRAAR